MIKSASLVDTEWSRPEDEDQIRRLPRCVGEVQGMSVALAVLDISMLPFLFII